MGLAHGGPNPKNDLLKGPGQARPGRAAAQTHPYSFSRKIAGIQEILTKSCAQFHQNSIKSLFLTFELENVFKKHFFSQFRIPLGHFVKFGESSTRRQAGSLHDCGRALYLTLRLPDVVCRSNSAESGGRAENVKPSRMHHRLWNARRLTVDSGKRFAKAQLTLPTNFLFKEIH